MSLPAIQVLDPDDARLADYRRLKERHLNAEGGRFVAESERVVRRLVGSRLTVHSVLLTPARLATLADALGGPFPVFVAAQPVLDAIGGFHVHRGCLAIGERPPPAPLPRGARALVVAEDLTDVDNLGALARHAAAFGADGLVLSPRCADPFYRKAIRVSLGAVFQLPVARAQAWPGDLEGLRADGVAIIGAVVDPGATPLARFDPPARFALLLGAEGPGLSAAARACCDHLVTIPMPAGPMPAGPMPAGPMPAGPMPAGPMPAGPMSIGADSLNVATAGAIFLYALSPSRR